MRIADMSVHPAESSVERVMLVRISFLNLPGID